MVEVMRDPRLQEAGDDILNRLYPNRNVSPGDYLSNLNFQQAEGQTMQMPTSEQMKQLQLQSIQQQGQKAAETQRQLEELRAQPKQADLTPYAIAIDSLTGSKLADKYQYMKPKGNQAEQKLLEQLSTQQNQAITDDLLKMQSQEENSRYMQGLLNQRIASAQDKKEGEISPFQKKKLETLGRSAGEYFSKDRTNLTANLPKVQNVIDLLDKRPDLTGSRVTKLVGSTGASVWDEDLAVAEQSMQSAIQDTLRPTLGAQFTENEGKRIMNLAFNPRLSTEENKRRALALQDIINSKVQFSDDLYAYIAEKGDDKGFPYEKYGMKKVGASHTPSGSPSPSNRAAELRKKHGL